SAEADCARWDCEGVGVRHVFGPPRTLSDVGHSTMSRANPHRQHCPLRLFRITREERRHFGSRVARSAKRLVYKCAWRGATWVWLVPLEESVRLSPTRRRRLTSEVELLQVPTLPIRELSSSTPASCPPCGRP